MKNILLAAFLAVAVVPSAFAQSQGIPEQVMARYYGAYDKKLNCWPAKVEQGKYCVRIESLNMLYLDAVRRIYILATGELLDDGNQLVDAHAAAGNVGAFILEEKNGSAQVLSVAAQNQFGSYGVPLSGWKFQLLGSGNHWGWINASGYTAQGYTSGQYEILMPIGKKISSVSRIAQMADNSGNCESKCTSMSSHFVVEDRNPSEKYYPIKFIASGVKDGKKILNKESIARFNSASEEYEISKDWPIKSY
jgi:hypothetical protein